MKIAIVCSKLDEAGMNIKEQLLKLVDFPNKIDGTCLPTAGKTSLPEAIQRHWQKSGLRFRQVLTKLLQKKQ